MKHIRGFFDWFLETNPILILLYLLILFFSFRCSKEVYENSFDLSQTSEINGIFESYSEDINDIFYSISRKARPTNFKLKLFLRDVNKPFTINGDYSYYLFLHNLVKGDTLKIHYIKNFDNRIRQLDLKGQTVYDYEENKARLNKAIQHKLFFILILSIIAIAIRKY